MSCPGFEPNEEDKAVASRIYGAHRAGIAVACPGCIAGIITAYRLRIEARVRVDAAREQEKLEEAE